MAGKLRELLSRAFSVFRRERFDRDLDEELREHLKLLVEEYSRRGMSPQEAFNAARKSFGGLEQAKDACRDQRGLPMLETFLQDLRYGFRVMRKNPGFAAVAVLTLALGIGANSAIFSVLDSVMLAVLPVRDPQQLLLVNWTSSDWPAIVEDLEGTNRKDPATGGWISQ